MQCPLCRDTELEPRFSRGIEVDVCPRCRGLWLDRGELERLLDEGGAAAPPSAPAPMPPPPPRRDDRGRDDRGWDDRDRRYDDDDREYRGGKRKKSKAKKLADLFEEVLDF